MANWFLWDVVGARDDAEAVVIVLLCWYECVVVCLCSRKKKEWQICKRGEEWEHTFRENGSLAESSSQSRSNRTADVFISTCLTHTYSFPLQYYSSQSRTTYSSVLSTATNSGTWITANAHDVKSNKQRGIAIFCACDSPLQILLAEKFHKLLFPY